MNDVLENRLLAGWARLLPRAPSQLGAMHESDCELVPLDARGERLLALTVDAIDEELDAGLYRSAQTAGRMAAIASLSDLAAVGAEPLGLLLSVALPVDEAESAQALVAAGVASTCAAAGTFVLGGDTSEASRLRIACTGVGTVPASGVLRRVGARPGDCLFASGRLGVGAALAAVNLLGVDGVDLDEDTFAPPCRLVHGRVLRNIASACIDTSDGLFAAVDQLARINGVAVHLDAPLRRLLEPRAERVRSRLGIEAFPFLATTHGEFELVFAVSPGRIPALEAVARAIDWQPVPLGSIREGEGLFVGATGVDGARIRNLLHESDGDVTAYLASIVSLGRALALG